MQKGKKHTHESKKKRKRHHNRSLFSQCSLNKHHLFFFYRIDWMPQTVHCAANQNQTSRGLLFATFFLSRKTNTPVLSIVSYGSYFRMPLVSIASLALFIRNVHRRAYEWVMMKNNTETAAHVMVCTIAHNVCWLDSIRHLYLRRWNDDNNKQQFCSTILCWISTNAN